MSEILKSQNPVYKIGRLLLFLLLFIGKTALFAQGFLKADGKRIVNEKGENMLLRGIGLGGYMLQEGYMLGLRNEGRQYKIRAAITDLMGENETREFYDTWLQNGMRKVDIDSLKAWGFNSVRLPMHYALYTLPVEKEPVAGQNTWLEKGFTLTDSLVAWCRADHIYLILDMHAAPGGQGNDLNISDRDPDKPSLWQSEANKQKMIALWKKLAERYANETAIGGYDIINEPNWGFEDLAADKNGLKEKGNAPLKKLMQDITTAIRGVDKNHLIIIEGNGWGNNYNGILGPWDSNMALSFHKYWNSNDQSSIEHMLKIRDQYSVPIWLGETGENSNVWITEAIALFEKNNIGWALWPLKKMGISNPMQIRTNLNYEDFQHYMNGHGRKPKESNVYSGLLELATYAKLENTFIHYDFLDAVFRQPFSKVTKPFKEHVLSDQLLLNAVDYDLGRNRFAYFDQDTADYHISGKPGIGNKGRAYRNDGVDIERDSSKYESYYITSIESGEWLQYTIDVRQTADYMVSLQVASTTADGSISLSVGGQRIESSVKVPQTGGEKKWQELKLKKYHLNRGMNTLRLYFDKGGFNVQSIRLNRSR